jgi:hypothetical protein
MRKFREWRKIDVFSRRTKNANKDGMWNFLQSIFWRNRSGKFAGHHVLRIYGEAKALNLIYCKFFLKLNQSPIFYTFPNPHWGIKSSKWNRIKRKSRETFCRANLREFSEMTLHTCSWKLDGVSYYVFKLIDDLKILNFPIIWE